MNETQIDHFRDLLTKLQNTLAVQDSIARNNQKTVELDQQSVGRLSRMDALQQQAMAIATQTRRDQQSMRIQSAFARIEEGEYGYCTDCGEEISLKRLELDPTAPNCVSCAAG